MTMMARSSAPLRRLFDRLDSAAELSATDLREVFEYWKGLRADGAVPQVAASEVEGLPSTAFICARIPEARDYAVERGSDAFDRLLGGGAGRLGAASDRKEAVRLRRLFDFVLDAGEPVVAQFTFSSLSGSSIADVLVAPLLSRTGVQDSVLGAVSLRRVETAPRWRIDEHAPLIFALPGAEDLAPDCSRLLHTTLSPIEVRNFDDGEHKVRPLTGVRRRDVFVFTNLTSGGGETVNDRLCKLLFFIGALKQSGAATVNVVAPYLCYARKERQTKPRDPVTLRYLAQLLEAIGMDRLLVLTVHDVPGFQNAFRCEAEHLDAHALFAHALAPSLSQADVCVASPDPGGEKRAELFREMLERRLGRPVAKALVDKRRSMGIVKGEIFAGDVKGRTVLIFDDLISTGNTMLRAARACRANGAQKIIAVATHALLSRGARAFLGASEIDQIWVTDSVPVQKDAHETARGRFHVVGTASLLAGAIHRIQTGGSLNDLLEHELEAQP